MRYKKGEVSLGRGAELAGVPVGKIMTILTEYGVEGRVEQEDCLQGLRVLVRYGDHRFVCPSFCN
jgi:predicted HTH domain antitoxin